MNTHVFGYMWQLLIRAVSLWGSLSLNTMSRSWRRYSLLSLCRLCNIQSESRLHSQITNLPSSLKTWAAVWIDFLNTLYNLSPLSLFPTLPSRGSWLAPVQPNLPAKHPSKLLWNIESSRGREEMQRHTQTHTHHASSLTLDRPVVDFCYSLNLIDLHRNTSPQTYSLHHRHDIDSNLPLMKTATSRLLISLFISRWVSMKWPLRVRSCRVLMHPAVRLMRQPSAVRVQIGEQTLPASRENLISLHN